MANPDVLSDQKNQAAWLVVGAVFHARHNGVAGMSRTSIGHLTANYYHTDEAKELGRTVNAKADPDPEKLHRCNTGRGPRQ